MSWRFLQGREVGSWEGSSLDGAPDALLKLTPTHKASCSIDSETESCHHSQSGTTCEHSTENHGEELSTSSAVDFHAKTLAQPEKAPESPGNKADCGVTWQELLVKYDLNTCSWKTRQCLFGEDYTQSSVILPRWGMMRHGACLALDMLEPRTNATDCGYWPTPSGTSNHGKNHVVGRLDEWWGFEQSVPLNEPPESALSRIRGVDDGVARRVVERTDCIRNGQVPAVAKLAWETLMETFK